MLKFFKSTEKQLPILISFAATGVTLTLTGYAAYLSNSVTLLSDFLKCFVEFFAIFLAFIVVAKTRKSDQSRFNYGFGKLEQISSTVVALAMFCSGILCLIVAVKRLSDPEPLENALFGFILAFLSVLGNGIMWRWFAYINKSSFSPVASSQSQLFLSKLLASFIVFVSLLCSFQIEAFPIFIYADALGSFFLGAFLLSSAHRMAIDSVGDLMDCSLDEALQIVILKTVIKHESHYKGFSHIRSRSSGSKRHIQVFLEFDDASTVESLRISASEIKRELEEVVPNSEVLIIPHWEA